MQSLAFIHRNAKRLLFVPFNIYKAFSLAMQTQRWQQYSEDFSLIASNLGHRSTWTIFFELNIIWMDLFIVNISSAVWLQSTYSYRCSWYRLFLPLLIDIHSNMPMVIELFQIFNFSSSCFCEILKLLTKMWLQAISKNFPKQNNLWCLHVCVQMWCRYYCMFHCFTWMDQTLKWKTALFERNEKEINSSMHT